MKVAHKPQEEIQRQIERALKKVKVGGLYFHFKNPEHLYVLESIGCLESTEEVCVCYRAQYGKGVLWIRTLEDFLGSKEIDGKKVSRFKAL